MEDEDDLDGPGAAPYDAELRWGRGGIAPGDSRASTSARMENRLSPADFLACCANARAAFSFRPSGGGQALSFVMSPEEDRDMDGLLVVERGMDEVARGVPLGAALTLGLVFVGYHDITVSLTYLREAPS